MTAAISRMNRTAQALTLLAALLLGLTYVAPVWSVRLVAPQYPEGIGMYIRLHTIEGMKEHDLDNINTLNHYIGMKAIEPEAFPELRYMPGIVAGLIAAGVAVAALGRRRLLVGWLAAFALLGAAGIYDFWRWSYDYGHNLDLEQAVIVIPDMSYQPPLLGTKQLLNFTATSMPSWGGLAAGLAFALAGAALFVSYHRRRRGVAILGTAVAAAACAPAPHIEFGVAQCAECRMLIADRRFGALLISSTGKAYPFDSVHCLLEYLERNPAQAQQNRGTWMVDAARPGVLLPAAEAVFVREGPLRAPMGSIVAFASNDAARAAVGAAADTFGWQELLSGAESVAR